MKSSFYRKIEGAFWFLDGYRSGKFFLLHSFCAVIMVGYLFVSERE